MGTMPKVSVIIPVYNAEKYLRQCLNSVVNQTLQDIEIICIDDGSTDNSLSILNEYKTTDNRIKVLSQDNHTAGAARNLGMSLATGQYIHFLDSDDWIDSDTYQRTTEVIDRTQSDVCIFNYRRYDNVTGNQIEVNLFGDEVKKDKFIVTNFRSEPKRFIYTSVVPWNKLYNRLFLTKNKITFDEIVCANDRTFYFRVISKSDTITLYNYSFVSYRVGNEDSLVGKTRIKHFDCHFAAFKSTELYTLNLPDEVRLMIFDVAISDMLLFFKRAASENKMVLAKKMGTFFNGLLSDEWYKQNLAKFNWCSEFYAFIYFSKIPVKYMETNAQIIPVVLAADDNYALYLSVTIQSIIERGNLEKFYDIYVLYTDISTRLQRLIKDQAARFDNVVITFLNVTNKVNAALLYSRAHYSKEMYYRLLIPEILYMYEKVLYIDCDLVALDDIANLYNFEIGENVLGGVVNIANDEMQRYIKNVLSLNPDSYINSGVLLINCTRFITERIREKCFKELEKRSKLVCPDQDILNICCSEEIYLLDSSWNFQWHQLVFSDITKSEFRRYSKQIEQMTATPHIVHYTSGKKAWNYPHVPYAYYFWGYARNTFAYEEILFREIDKKIQSSVLALYTQHNGNAKQELSAIHRSRYKPSYFILLFLKKIRGGLRCYREHGFQYTLRRLKEQLLCAFRR